MEKLSNKRISTPIAIGIIVVLTVLAGGFTLWQYLEMDKEGFGLSDVEISKKEQGIENYLHGDALLKEEMTLTNIDGVTQMMVESGYFSVSAEQISLFAVQHLQDRNVSQIKICEVSWIAAPLGCFLIDGKGSFSEGTKHYSTFRIGVIDGSKGDAGKEFTFIARGEDNKGNVIWYPESGNKFFLSEKDREDFEDLSLRFK